MVVFVFKVGVIFVNLRVVIWKVLFCIIVFKMCCVIDDILKVDFLCVLCFNSDLLSFWMCGLIWDIMFINFLFW